MSSPVQRTFNRPTLLGSIPSPCPPVVPPFVNGGLLQGDGPPTSEPVNVYSSWMYFDRIALQNWTWNNVLKIWE